MQCSLVVRRNGATSSECRDKIQNGSNAKGSVELRSYSRTTFSQFTDTKISEYKTIKDEA
jgi:hypothetical protein